MLKYNKLKPKPFTLECDSEDVIKHHYSPDALIISTRCAMYEAGPYDIATPVALRWSDFIWLIGSLLVCQCLPPTPQQTLCESRDFAVFAVVTLELRTALTHSGHSEILI